MKQNSDNIRVSLVRQIELPWITANTREFNLSHVPNLLDTNRINQKLCSVCASVVV